MSELVFNAIFQDVSRTFRDQPFSAMYFGRHFGKNLLILLHDLTLMIVLGDAPLLSAPELRKAVSFRGDRRKGIQIVGSENVILLLDELGSLWRLINGYEVSSRENECFHSLKEECFYEWVPYKKFNFKKVLAITALGQGFACLGVCGNNKKKLVVLSSVDSTLEEYTFGELNTQESKLSCYYLTNLKVQSSVFETSPTSERILVADRFTGRTYLCAKNGRSSLVNVSNNFLISAMHLEEEKCLLLCFQNGKLVFCPLSKFERQSVAYLSKKVTFVDKCCCPDTCLLWSDGISLNHTKLKYSENGIKLSHLKLSCCIQSPLSIVKVHQHVLVVTINNFYYCVSAGVKSGSEIRKQPQQLLSEICKGSSLSEELERKTDLLAHYLHCKDIMQKSSIKEKTEIKWEGKCLAIKSHLGISLREDLWKMQLMSPILQRNFVHVVDLESDLSKEALIVVENPFKSKCTIKVRLIGYFDKKDLFLDLGEISQSGQDSYKDHLGKQIQQILKNRNKFHTKGTYSNKTSFA